MSSRQQFDCVKVLTWAAAMHTVPVPFPRALLPLRVSQIICDRFGGAYDSRH